MGHMLCFCPMGFSVSPATVVRGGEDSLSYRLQLRFKKCTSEGDLYKPSVALDCSSLQMHNTELLTAKLKLTLPNEHRTWKPLCNRFR
jgi:hypothetical protein